ncbi:ethanolamine-phosphate cytidylyltransferase [Folsomia candida]|uniref:ethanolamine-phosphate cytidylyltransferase n=1 Tax=Folsomia candida TaxID=158441 RepID=UPI000B90574E|nr:ethanolamine-phosphate cytidylyltransferase [Folsomia candida]
MDKMDTSNEMMTMDSNNNNGVTKIWCDGCYDITHFGHSNNLRQAKELGDVLIVGVHSDAEIEKNKGSRPVFTEEERYALIRGIKWVDQVIENAPYCTTLETLDKYECQFCAHGNDITTTDAGVDTYQMVKDAGRYKEVDRTQGVSTTDLVKRILKSDPTKNSDNSTVPEIISPYTGSTQFLATTRKLKQFAAMKDPPPNARVVYVAGTFDLFHPGHLAFLEAARALGDFLIVGLYDDTISARTSPTGIQFPIMTLLERVQNILGYRVVDEVVIGAPFTISRDLLDHLQVAVVAHGIETQILPDPDTRKDPYEVPKSLGIFAEVDSGSTLVTRDLLDRVLANRAVYEKRNADKERKELARLHADLGKQEQIMANMQAED